MNRQSRPAIYFNVHLVSDSTGETLNAVQRAACAQFENVQPLEHNYYLVRSERQLERVTREIEAAPGVVWYTITDPVLRGRLEAFCRERNIPTLPVLDASIAMLGRHLGVAPNNRVAGQHAMDEDYFERMEAINFTLAHDDGQNVESLIGADVILLGVSRTSKTPTCVYLANRKVRAGNIPLVPGVPLPDFLEQLGDKGPLVVGLKISAERLVQIRRQRLLSLNQDDAGEYADEESVRDEITQANRLFQRNNWKTIDVSRRSVEETAAAILNLLNERRGASVSLAVTLASGSASRRAVLAAAGVVADAVAPNVDEDAFRTALRAEGVSVRDQAMQLAELKAVRISQSRPGLVIGGDQMLALGDTAFDKPKDIAEARRHLERLSGQTHTLETAIVICEEGRPVWRHLARPRLTMRPLSPAFIDGYLDACGDKLLSTVGAYQLEGLGAQLFTRIEGDYFSILGLPLLPLLDYLRVRKVLPQ